MTSPKELQRKIRSSLHPGSEEWEALDTLISRLEAYEAEHEAAVARDDVAWLAAHEHAERVRRSERT